jgi:catechol 2,3-dioxygenase
VHLQVSELARSEAFYRHAVGFRRTARYGAEAVFLAAGGYHHHLGLNTWLSGGEPPAPPGSAGLVAFSVRLPRAEDVEVRVRWLDARRVPWERDPAGRVTLRDPDGVAVLLEGPPAGA